jgi:hypothetical protein
MRIHGVNRPTAVPSAKYWVHRRLPGSFQAVAILSMPRRYFPVTGLYLLSTPVEVERSAFTVALGRAGFRFSSDGAPDESQAREL